MSAISISDTRQSIGDTLLTGLQKHLLRLGLTPDTNDSEIDLLVKIFGRETRALQSADQDVVSSTTLVDCIRPVPIEASATYEFVAKLQFNEVGTAAGIRVGVNGPSSPTKLVVSGLIQTSGGTFSAASAAAYGVLINTGAIASTGVKWALVWGQVVNGATAGQLSIQFAQSVSDVSAVTLKQGSSLIVTRL